MEWKDLLQDLINIVETAAPKLWEIALRQVWVEAIGWALAFVVLGSISITLIFLGKRFLAVSQSNFLEEWDEEYENGFALIVCGLMVFALDLASFYKIVARLINPEYYAIELLVRYIQ